MDNGRNIQRERDTLSSMRLRFSPEVQPIREAACDGIIESILFVNAEEQGLAFDDILRLVAKECQLPTVAREQITESLGRLETASKVLTLEVVGEVLHTLSPQAREAIGQARHQAELQFDAIVEELFRDIPGGPGQYSDCFLRSLCYIFAELAEEAARLIRGDLVGEQIAGSALLSHVVASICDEFPEVSGEILLTRLKGFFKERDPRHASLQLELAQNYYIVKAFGADPSGSVLSHEIFDGAEFYLDTNVLIGALAPTQGEQSGIKALVKACREGGISFIGCRISFEELRRVQDHARIDAEELKDKVPPGISRRLTSTSNAKADERWEYIQPPLEYDDEFLELLDPEAQAKEFFGLYVLDDEWFDSNESSAAIRKFSQALRQRSPSKGEAAGIHDALLLTWVAQQRLNYGGKAYVLTRDRSLPQATPPGGPSTPVAITHTAMLQWATPVITGEERQDFASAFADLVRARLLPQYPVLSLGDFRVFYELHISTQDLPEEDVEDCIRYLKKNAMDLNPTDSKDLQKLAREVARFFADPARKINQEIKRLQAEAEELRTKHEGVITRLKEEHDAGLEKMAAEYEKELKEAQRSIDNLKKEHGKALGQLGKEHSDLRGDFENLREDMRLAAARRSAVLRLCVSGIIGFLAVAIVGGIAGTQGEGPVFTRIVAAWHMMLGIGGGLFTAFTWFYVGKERLKSIGWPFK